MWQWITYLPVKSTKRERNVMLPFVARWRCLARSAPAAFRTRTLCPSHESISRTEHGRHRIRWKLCPPNPGASSYETEHIVTPAGTPLGAAAIQSVLNNLKQHKPRPAQSRRGGAGVKH